MIGVTESSIYNWEANRVAAVVEFFPAIEILAYTAQVSLETENKGMPEARFCPHEHNR
jgi:hypothetical protein